MGARRKKCWFRSWQQSFPDQMVNEAHHRSPLSHGIAPAGLKMADERLDPHWQFSDVSNATLFKELAEAKQSGGVAAKAVRRKSP